MTLADVETARARIAEAVYPPGGPGHRRGCPHLEAIVAAVAAAGYAVGEISRSEAA